MSCLFSAAFDGSAPLSFKKMMLSIDLITELSRFRNCLSLQKTSLSEENKYPAKQLFVGNIQGDSSESLILEHLWKNSFAYMKIRISFIIKKIKAKRNPWQNGSGKGQ